jgi:hypothetical protein
MKTIVLSELGELIGQTFRFSSRPCGVVGCQSVIPQTGQRAESKLSVYRDMRDHQRHGNRPLVVQAGVRLNIEDRHIHVERRHHIAQWRREELPGFWIHTRDMYASFHRWCDERVDKDDRPKRKAFTRRMGEFGALSQILEYLSPSENR